MEEDLVTEILNRTEIIELGEQLDDGRRWKGIFKLLSKITFTRPWLA